MLCGVTATLGSNPSATATAARPHWGRAVLLCLAGVPCGCVAVWPHGCSGRRRPRPPARLGDLTAFGAAPRSPPVPSGPSGALHTSGAGSLTCACALSRSPARPRRPRGGLQSVGVSVCCLAWPRRPRASQPGPPVTAGALHAGGAFVADVAGASARCSARPRRFLWASRGSRVLSFWGGLVCVVTNVVNLMAFWLKMVVTGQFAR